MRGREKKGKRLLVKMMIRNRAPFFLVSIPLCLTLLLHLVPSNATVELIEKVCSQTHSKVHCVASLESNPDSANATLNQLGLIALKLANANATAASSYINSMLNKAESLEPAIDQSLRDCDDLYMDAIEQLHDSIAAVLNGSNKEVAAWVAAAIADVESCEDGLKPHPHKTGIPNLSSRNAMFRQLLNNVLQINRMILGQHKGQ